MTNNNTRILVYAVVVLSILNIATFGTIAYHIKKSNNNKGVIEASDTENQVNYNGRYFRDKLKLNPAQMQDFKVVHFAFRDEARKINQELIQKRKLMLTEMQKENPDTILLNEYSNNIGTLHSHLKKESYRYYTGIRQICNEDQVTELNKLFNAFFISDHIKNGQGKGRGYKGPHRQGNQNQ